MKILITGGCGFVGSNLAIYLKKKRISTQINSLDNLSRKGTLLNLNRLKKNKIKNFKIDISNNKALKKLPKYDLIVDCCAEAAVEASKKEVDMCVNKIEEAIQGTKEIDVMIEVRNELIKNIEKKPEVSHWCFFTILNNLDKFLDYEIEKISVKKEMFSKKMTQLWVLSKSLDAFFEVEDYFLFLRSRYLSLSQKVFGRRLKIISPSVGSEFLIEEKKIKGSNNNELEENPDEK